MKTVNTKLFDINANIEQNALNPFIISAEHILSYQDFFRIVHNTEIRLRQQDVKMGDRVALLGKNSVDYLVLLMALWQIGAVAVPVSTRFPEKQIAELLGEIGCKKIIDLSNPPISISSFDKHSRLHVIPKRKGASRNPASGIRHQISSKIAENFAFCKIQLKQNATIIFTSGSSGQSKAALHTFGNHYYSALGSNENISFTTGDRWLLSLPLYHVGGLAMFFRALVSGGALVISDSKESTSETIEKYKVTHVSLVATQLYRLLNENRNSIALARLKAILLGGSAIPQSLIRQAVELNLPIYTSYGSTEMSSQITTTPPKADVESLLTSGKLLNYRELKFSPDEEILVKGKTLFQGYVEKKSLYRNTSADNWFPTGDIGKFDAEGFLIVLGRKDNMFISGGENIQPEEIEKWLNQIENVVQAIVTKVEDKEFGWRPVAFIEMSKDVSIDESVIQSYLRQHLAGFKIPDYFFPWPKKITQSGIKLNRKHFQKLAEEMLTQMR